MNKTLKNRCVTQRIKATAGDELSLLVNLTRDGKIGTRMLLRNVAEIVHDDPSLLVDVVLLLTDPQRNAQAEIGVEEYRDAYNAVVAADGLRGAGVLAEAIADGAKKAGYGCLNLPEGQAA